MGGVWLAKTIQPTLGLAFGAVALFVSAGHSIAADSQNSTLNNLTLSFLLQSPPKLSSLIKIGSCSITCGTSSASNDCAEGQSCTCYCNGGPDGNPVCNSCQ